jgi:gliding motility-associated-like protein
MQGAETMYKRNSEVNKCKNQYTLWVLLLFTFGFQNIYAQRQTANWFFGLSAGLDFNCNPPDTIRGASSFYALEGSSSISDENGNLLFYTNGDSVWNRRHKVMPNGYGLGQNPQCGNSSTQGSLIVPVPESDSLFYIFTTDCAEWNLGNGFRYSIVDMSMNGGMGDVRVRSVKLIDTVVEKIAAVHHSNGKDIWVLTHKFNSDEFYAYLITKNGINTTPIVSKQGQIQYYSPALPFNRTCMARGMMKFSPDGKKLIVLSTSDCNLYPLRAEMFKFNDTTGAVNLDYSIDDPDSTMYYAASFSFDSKLLYLTTGWLNVNLHQFDVENSNSSTSFLASKIVIHTRPQMSNPSMLVGLSMAPNGKIYISTNREYLDAINYPNLRDTFCGYQQQAITLKKCPYQTYSALSSINFVQSFFRDTFIGRSCKDTLWANFNYTVNCVDKTIHFIDSSGPQKEMAYYYWEFGDSSNGVPNTSYLINPTHQYAKKGTYQVRLTVSKYPLNSTCKTANIVKTVLINNCQLDTVFRNFEICESDTLKFRGKSYFNKGKYLDTIESTIGIDTLYVIDVKLLKKSISFYLRQLCPGDSVLISGVYYKDEGDVSETFVNYLGCDSIFTTHLEYKMRSKLSQKLIFCDSAKVVVGEKIYIQEGLYTDTLINYLGCDSVVETEIKIHPSNRSNINYSICQGDSIKIGNKYFNSEISFEDTFKNIYQCDSIVGHNITIKPILLTDTSIIFCQSDTIFLNGKPHFVEQNVTDSFKTINGCDSFHTYILKFEEKNKCDCVDDFGVPNVFTPNLDSYNDYFPEYYKEGLKVEIFNRWGILIFNSSDGKGWDGLYKGNSVPNGTYYYIISYINCRNVKVNVSGIVTLIF